MSPRDIVDVIDSYKRKKEREERVEIERLFVLAQAISTRVAFVFTDEANRTEDMILKPWDVYPDMFDDERKQEEERKALAELEAYKQRRSQYANRINREVTNGDTA